MNIEKLNGKTKYKYVGGVNIGDEINLPEKWECIIAITTNTAGRPPLEMIVPYNYVEYETKGISNGYYHSSTYYGYARITCSASKIIFNECTHCEHTPSDARLFVYYR